jgi:hypothetical protein
MHEDAGPSPNAACRHRRDLPPTLPAPSSLAAYPPGRHGQDDRLVLPGLPHRQVHHAPFRSANVLDGSLETKLNHGPTLYRDDRVPRSQTDLGRSTASDHAPDHERVSTRRQHRSNSRQLDTWLFIGLRGVELPTFPGRSRFAPQTEHTRTPRPQRHSSLREALLRDSFPGRRQATRGF